MEKTAVLDPIQRKEAQITTPNMQQVQVQTNVSSAVEEAGIKPFSAEHAAPPASLPPARTPEMVAVGAEILGHDESDISSKDFEHMVVEPALGIKTFGRVTSKLTGFREALKRIKDLGNAPKKKEFDLKQ